MSLPWAGRQVLVTRAAESAPSLGQKLTDLGAEPIYLPCLDVEPLSSPEELTEVFAQREQIDLVLLGSPTAAERLLALDPQPDSLWKVACVGKKTAAALQRDSQLARRFEVVITAQEHRSEGLIKALDEHFYPQSLADKCFFFPRALEGRTHLIEVLEEAGAKVLNYPVYRLAPGPTISEQQKDSLQTVQIVTFMSGQTLVNFLRMWGPEAGRNYLKERLVAVVGPVAAEKARGLGVFVDVVPENASTEAMLQAIEAHLLTSPQG